MASISNDPGGRRRIQFVDKDGKRKTLRLGKVSQRVAEEIKLKVEALNAAAIAGMSWDGETAKWVSNLTPVLADKLATVGLIPRRRSRESAVLGPFLDAYIARRTDVKTNTRENFEACRARLVGFFGADRQLGDITAGDADAFVLSLRERYAAGTVGRAVKRAKQFFQAAVRARLIPENPLADVKGFNHADEGRKFFVDRATAAKVLDACPDAEWRLLFALSRFGGLRCPSEHFALTWADVDWERGRFLVRSSKTEHHEGKGERWVPIFPELRPHLEQAFETAEEGAVYVFPHRRDTTANLRTRLMKIIHRAGLTPWPKLFHNLRASRETELAATYPLHVVCAWIGNSQRIAAKHYLLVTDDYFQAAQLATGVGAAPGESGAKSGAATSRNGSHAVASSSEACSQGDAVRDVATACDLMHEQKYPWRDSNPRPAD